MKKDRKEFTVQVPVSFVIHFDQLINKIKDSIDDYISEQLPCDLFYEDVPKEMIDYIYNELIERLKERGEKNEENR